MFSITATRSQSGPVQVPPQSLGIVKKQVLLTLHSVNKLLSSTPPTNQLSPSSKNSNKSAGFISLLPMRVAIRIDDTETNLIIEEFSYSNNKAFYIIIDQ